MTTLYQQDDAASWADWTAKNPPPLGSGRSWAAQSADEQDMHLRYMAGYYNCILLSGGTVGNVALLNPYVYVWNGAARRYMPRDEAAEYGPGSEGGITVGPHEPRPTVTIGNEQRAPAPSNQPEVAATGVTPPAPAPAPWAGFSLPKAEAPAPAPAPTWRQRILAWLNRLFGR